MPRLATIVAAIAPCLVLSGCLGPEVIATAGFSAAQTGVFEFRKGSLRTAWDAPMDMMLEGVKQALMGLDYPVEVAKDEGNTWIVRSKEVDGSDIDITLYRSSPRVTVVSIRVGTWGDQPLAKLIADRVDKKIRQWEDRAERPPPAAPAGP